MTFQCNKTQAECNERMTILKQKVENIQLALDAMNVRIYDLDEQLVEIAKNPNTPAKAFEDIEILITRYTKLCVRISNKRYGIAQALIQLEDDRSHCKRLNYVCMT